MKKSRIERLQLAVMAVCLVCCVTLLMSVAFDRPLTHPAAAHVPVLRTEAPESGVWPGEHDLSEEKREETAEAGTQDETAEAENTAAGPEE